MTGYGAGSAQVGSASLVVEVRAVNHRFLDVRTRLPAVLADYTNAVDELARKLLVRGRIEIGARLEGVLEGQVALSRERARSALVALQELRDELGLRESVPLSLLAAVPGLFVEQARDAEDMHRAIVEAAETACQALLAMRRREGEALASDLRGRVARVHALCGTVAARAPELTIRYRDKLRARLQALLAGSAVTLDAGRLEQEVAVLADRSDVTEELTRMASHCRQFEALIGPGDEPIGRRLEFLLQEMGREVNTLGAKVDDLELTAVMLDLKAELERLREQVQNVL